MSPSSRNRHLSEFFSIPIQEISVRRSLPFSLFLYLTKNEHLLLWRASGDPIEKSEVLRLKESGVSNLWIPIPERQAHENWRETQTRRSRAMTPEGSLMRAVLGTSPNGMPQLTRARFCEEAGKTLLSRACRAKTPEEEQERDARMQLALLDALGFPSDPTSHSLQLLWSLSLSFSKPLHSVSVSMLAVILALGFKKNDSGWLARVAFAGLFKDCRAPKEALSTLLRASDLSQVMSWIEQSRLQIQTFETDEAILILALASAVEKVRAGAYDGKLKLRSEAFKIISESQTSGGLHRSLSLPNPEIIQPVIRWISEYSKFQLHAESKPAA